MQKYIFFLNLFKESQTFKKLNHTKHIFRVATKLLKSSQNEYRIALASDDNQLMLFLN